MSEESHILISLEERHAENIFSGRKQVELRRRKMNILPGTIVWIYVKLPLGSIVGRATIVNVHDLPPSRLWNDFGPVSGLTRDQFFDYFHDVERGIALEIAGAERLQNFLSLEGIREISTHFQPPQFFMRLGPEHPVLSAVRATR